MLSAIVLASLHLLGTRALELCRGFDRNLIGEVKWTPPKLAEQADWRGGDPTLSSHTRSSMRRTWD